MRDATPDDLNFLQSALDDARSRMPTVESLEQQLATFEAMPDHITPLTRDEELELLKRGLRICDPDGELTRHAIPKALVEGGTPSYSSMKANEEAYTRQVGGGSVTIPLQMVTMGEDGVERTVNVGSHVVPANSCNCDGEPMFGHFIVTGPTGAASSAAEMAGHPLEKFLREPIPCGPGCELSSGGFTPREEVTTIAIAAFDDGLGKPGTGGTGGPGADGDEPPPPVDENGGWDGSGEPPSHSKAGRGVAIVLTLLLFTIGGMGFYAGYIVGEGHGYDNARSSIDRMAEQSGIREEASYNSAIQTLDRFAEAGLVERDVAENMKRAISIKRVWMLADRLDDGYPKVPIPAPTSTAPIFKSTDQPGEVQ